MSKSGMSYCSKVKEFKDLRVLFRSEWGVEPKIDRLVQRQQQRGCCTDVVKKELSVKAKPSLVDLHSHPHRWHMNEIADKRWK